jgi:hypothetical protein
VPAKKGLPVVYEGRRINLRVHQRIFHPVVKTLNGERHTLYSDTGREKEIRYASVEYYGLDDPLNRVRLIRLARAMNCLTSSDESGAERECTVTICRAKELYGVDGEEMRWVPFDPKKLESLEEKVKNLRRRVEWRRRVGLAEDLDEVR